jgi:arylsulfatase A-like enzyme
MSLAVTLRALALAGTALLIGACGGARDSPPRHVLLISIDSLRADRLGCYGNPRETSPTIDRLAAEGTRFEHAYSPSSWTLPSHATLLTGLAQYHHGAVLPDRRIPPGTPGLASILKARGYRTRGVYSGPFLEPIFGFGQGFDEYVSCETETSGDMSEKLARSHGDETNPCLLRTVERWAREPDDGPSFWFLHMWDVHYDYIPPPEYVRRFDPRYHGKLTGRNIAGKGFPKTARPRDVAHLLACYDGEVRYTDDTIAAMLNALDGAGRLESTLVVVTADHGDEFLEHGGTGHQKTVFPESVGIPLVFRGPGVPRGRVIRTPVGLQDVAPTILALLHVPATGMDGMSLEELMRGTRRVHPPVVSVLYVPFRRRQLPGIVTMAIRSPGETLLRPPWSSRWVAYDSARDPLEEIPMPIRAEERLDRAGALLRARRLDGNELGDAGRIEAVPEPVEQRLKDLGYLE